MTLKWLVKWIFSPKDDFLSEVGDSKMITKSLIPHLIYFSASQLPYDVQEQKARCFPPPHPQFSSWSIQTNLYVCTWVNLVNSIPWRTPCFSVQVVALNEDRVVTEASNPHVTFSFALQLHPFPYVQPWKEKENNKKRGWMHLCL